MKKHTYRLSGYTLIELCLVVLILSLLAAAAARYSTSVTTAKNTAELNATLKAIEEALRSYSTAYTRLPCPSDITLSDNSANFGKEVGTSGDGNCTGYNFINSGADPDAADPNYVVSTNYVVAGGVPTKTLKLDDRFAYDPWGRRILFAVDKRMTATSAFTTYTITNTTVGAIVIKHNSTDTLANANTYKAIYALVSFGANGHGGYMRNPSATSTRFNGASTNTNEQKNCHCDSSATATAFDRIFVRTTKTPSTTLTNIYDDIVSFKTRAQLATNAQLQ